MLWNGRGVELASEQKRKRGEREGWGRKGFASMRSMMRSKGAGRSMARETWQQQAAWGSCRASDGRGFYRTGRSGRDEKGGAQAASGRLAIPSPPRQRTRRNAASAGT
jgi:hypothetical protein